jgi:hypothetical protein
MQSRLLPAAAFFPNLFNLRNLRMYLREERAVAGKAMALERWLRR